MIGFGALAQPWWIPLLFVLIVGHLTNICTTLYLHRSKTHGGVEFRPLVEHLMRLWLWLTTGVVTREWVAVHRKHHAYADREGDPHSPAVSGFWGIVLGGVFFYQRAARDPAVVEKYGGGCPDDWMEQHVYTGRRSLGIVLMLLIDVYLFGFLVGLLVWSFMAIWTPIMGNIINGIGHALGYRNFPTKDESRNLYPWGIWILGEELHNNHHADPRSAKFKARWWEFDIGWIYIRLLSALRLARVLYARSVSAREFAARHYNERVAQPVAAQLDRASARLEKAKAGARAKVKGAKAEARARVRSARAEARAAVKSARAEARAKVQDAKAGARAKVQDAKAGARTRVQVAKAEARAKVEEAKAGLHKPQPARD